MYSLPSSHRIRFNNMILTPWIHEKFRGLACVGARGPIRLDGIMILRRIRTKLRRRVLISCRFNNIIIIHRNSKITRGTRARDRPWKRSQHKMLLFLIPYGLARAEMRNNPERRWMRYLYCCFLQPWRLAPSLGTEGGFLCRWPSWDLLLCIFITKTIFLEQSDRGRWWSAALPHHRVYRSIIKYEKTCTPRIC